MDKPLRARSRVLVPLVALAGLVVGWVTDVDTSVVSSTVLIVVALVAAVRNDPPWVRPLALSVAASAWLFMAVVLLVVATE